MKILTIHADFIEFEAKKKAFKGAEESIKEGKQRIEECLVVFSAVEKRDEENTTAVTQRYVGEIKNVAQQVHATNIVLYPYAHLSSSLSSPIIAEQLMKDAEKILATEYKVTRAPFGWYKSFNISCKGHPLSELSREFSSDGADGKALVNKPISETANLKREYKDESFTFESKILSKEHKIKLSAAILSAKAVMDLYTGFKESETKSNIKIGGIGFYHDQAYVDISGIKIKQEDLPRIEKQVHKIITEKISFQAAKLNEVKDSLQLQIAQDLGKKAVAYKLVAGTSSSSSSSSFVSLTMVPSFDLPFVESSTEIGAFKILNSASVYWKNNSNNEQLTRIYSVAFSRKEDLDEYIAKQEDAENRSHLKIGKEQGLFVVSELVGAGLPLIAPKGTIIRNEIIKYLWDLHKNKGYQQVWTPHIAKDVLYKTSGHWDKFGDELFKVKGKSEDFVLKPMNCPHHMQIFSSFSFSYKDLPVRYFEPATVYRDEKSGQLNGLVRVRSITQDDGHLFCRMSQITQEVRIIVEVIHEFYHTIGLDKDYWVSLSVKGEDKTKYLGSDEGWKTAEAVLEKAVKELKLPYKKRLGEAAFYGPKLDFMFKDALGREWQLATIQCDFNLPERFNLYYMNEKSEKERPIVIHRAISGSLERFMSILIEHFAGKFPSWLSPVQVKILTVTDRNIPFAQNILQILREKDIRVELDDQAESIGKKVRNAQMEKVNYMITIGDKEVEKKTLAVRTRDGEVKFDVKVDDFVSQLLKEIEKKEIR